MVTHRKSENTEQESEEDRPTKDQFEELRRVAISVMQQHARRAIQAIEKRFEPVPGNIEVLSKYLKTHEAAKFDN
jgi:hypothetical protein